MDCFGIIDFFVGEWKELLKALTFSNKQVFVYTANQIFVAAFLLVVWKLFADKNYYHKLI